MTVEITELKVGETAKVIGFNPGNNPAYLKRLLAMGLVHDAEFKVLRMAPLGDPIEIRLHGFSLCLRKQEGRVLLLEKVERA